MPIFSYLAIPEKGARKKLCTDLSRLDFCQVIPAENEEVVVVVTDTPDEISEKNLRKEFKKLESLQSLSLVFGYDDKE